MHRAAKILCHRLKAAKTFSNFAFFSERLDEIQKLQQEAYLASLLIDKISTPRSVAQIQKQSLSEHLQSVISQCKEVAQPAKDEMLQYFREGVVVDQNVFMYDRQFSAGLKQLQQNQTSDSQLKMIYFPTSIVTSQIFAYIIGKEFTKRSNLMMGHYGISKTISLQLYSHLSNRICKYLIKNQVASKQLRQKIKCYPKLIYWRILEQDNQQSVRERILLQCQQIGEEIKEYNLLQGLKKSQWIKKFYKRYNINVRLSVDQLSVLSNKKRTYLESRQKEGPLITEIKKKISQHGFQSLSKNQALIHQNFIQQKIHSNRLQKILKTLQLQFDKYFYFSSVIIQEKVLSTIQLSPDKHISSKVIRVPYAELLNLKSTIYELLDYFLFSISWKIISPMFDRKSPLSKIYFQNKQQIRKQLYNYMQIISQEYILTPLSISDYLSDFNSKIQKQIGEINLQNLNFKDRDDLEIIIQKFKYIIDQLVKKSKDDLQLNFQKFLNKLDKNQRYQIYNEIIFSQFRTQNVNDPLLRHEIDLAVVNNGIEYFKSTVNGHLFYQHKQIDGSKKIYSLFPKKFLLKFIRPQFDIVIRHMLHDYSEVQIQNIYKRDKRGQYFQKIFIEAITLGKIKLQFQRLPFVLPQFPKKRLGFVPIPQDLQKRKEFHLMEGFQPYFLKIRQQMIDKKTKLSCNVLLPLLQQYTDEVSVKKFLQNQQEILYDQHLKKNSMCIDFIISVYQKSMLDPSHQIFAFDLTIGRQVQQKISNFLKTYTELANPYPQGSFQPILSDSQQRRLHFFVISPIEQLDGQWKKRICNKFRGQIQFDENLDEKPFDEKAINKNALDNIIKIKNVKGHKDSLLHSVGYLYLGDSDMLMYDYQWNKKISYFDQLIKIVGQEVSRYQKQKKRKSKID